MVQRTLAARGIAALTALLVAAAYGQGDAWKHSDAVARLRICASSVYAHQVRVDLPEALASTVKGVAAYTQDGSRVPASPVTLGGRTVAVWLALGRVAQAAMGPGDDGIQLPIQIYLFDQATIPVPLTEQTRRPARMVRTARPLTTRPFTSAEALLLLGSLTGSGRPLYAFDAPAMGDALVHSQGPVASERRAAVMHWSTAVLLEAPARVAFGSNTAQVAWFTAVDGRPVAEWRLAADDSKGAFWGEPVDLAAGLHTVEFLVVQRYEEPLPSVLWRADGKAPEPLVGSCPATHPEAVEVQRAASGPRYGIRLARVRRMLFQDTGADILCFTPMGAEGSPLSDAVAVSLAGARLDPKAAAEGMLSPAPRLPAVELALPEGTSLRLPARPVWAPPERRTGTCRLGDLPPVVAASAPLPLAVSVSLGDDEADPRLLSRTTVVARQTDAAGKTLSELPVGSGRPGSCQGDLALLPETARVMIEVRADGALLLPALPVRVLRGGDDLTGLRAAGDALFQAGERVVLACRPLTALPAPAGRVADGACERLGILDDLCATLDAPGAALLPERVLGQSWRPPPAVFRESLADGVGDGVLPGVAKFAALARLLEMRPDTLVLAVGAADLRRGRPAREVSRDLLFLAQAAAAAGARPVLLALPRLPGVPAAESREAAILCKELAWELRAAVIDAHSAERLDGLAANEFAGTFAVADGHIALAGPNDQGRQWLCNLLDRSLADLGRARGQ